MRQQKNTYMFLDTAGVICESVKGLREHSPVL